jgi:hypothetical protein
MRERCNPIVDDIKTPEDGCIALLGAIVLVAKRDAERGQPEAATWLRNFLGEDYEWKRQSKLNRAML